MRVNETEPFRVHARLMDREPTRWIEQCPRQEKCYATRPDDRFSANRDRLPAADQCGQRAGGALRDENRKPVDAPGPGEERDRAQARGDPEPLKRWQLRRRGAM